MNKLSLISSSSRTESILKSSLAGLLISAISTLAIAEATQDFNLVNDTGYTIDQVYVSPHDTDEWLNDILGQEVLNNGESGTVTFSPSNEVCVYDLKVIYDDAEEAEWGSINLCEESTITIHWDKESGQSSATFE